MIRFGKDSQDFTGPMAGLKEPVAVELAILRHKSLPNIHAKFSFVQEVGGGLCFFHVVLGTAAGLGAPGQVAGCTGAGCFLLS